MSLIVGSGDGWKMAMVIWMAELPSPKTRDTYKIAWRQFMQFCPAPLSEIQMEHVVAWKQTLLAKKLSHETINLKLAALTSFFNYASDKYSQLLPPGWRNPAKEVARLPVNPYGKATFLDGDDDLKLLRSIDRSTVEGKRDFAIILMFLVTGLRVSPVTLARRSSLIKKGTKIALRYDNKGGKVRDIPLAPVVIEAMNDYLATRNDDNDALWLRPTGKGMKPREVQKMMRRRCDAAFGVGHNIVPHSLRHTAAMQAIKNGSITDVTALLAHSSSRVTHIYIQHIDPSTVDKTVGKLGDRYS